VINTTFEDILSMVSKLLRQETWGHLEPMKGVGEIISRRVSHEPSTVVDMALLQAAIQTACWWIDCPLWVGSCSPAFGNRSPQSRLSRDHASLPCKCVNASVVLCNDCDVLVSALNSVASSLNSSFIEMMMLIHSAL
jgi:hypothetical protein